MESWAGPFSPCSAPNGGSLGARLSSGFALHSAERWHPQRSLSPDLLPVSLCSPRPHAGARAPYPAVLARPHLADTPDSKMASVGKHGEPVGPVRLEARAGPGLIDALGGEELRSACLRCGPSPRPHPTRTGPFARVLRCPTFLCSLAAPPGCGREG